MTLDAQENEFHEGVDLLKYARAYGSRERINRCELHLYEILTKMRATRETSEEIIDARLKEANLNKRTLDVLEHDYMRANHGSQALY